MGALCLTVIDLIWREIKLFFFFLVLHALHTISKYPIQGYSIQRIKVSDSTEPIRAVDHVFHTKVLPKITKVASWGDILIPARHVPPPLDHAPFASHGIFWFAGVPPTHDRPFGPEADALSLPLSPLFPNWGARSCSLNVWRGTGLWKVWGTLS